MFRYSWKKKIFNEFLKAFAIYGFVKKFKHPDKIIKISRDLFLKCYSSLYFATNHAFSHVDKASYVLLILIN